jgi:hypothetical protein
VGRAACGVLLLIVASFAGTCAPAGASAASKGTKVAVIFGDSLTYESEAFIVAPAGWDIDEYAIGGLGVCDLLAGLRRTLKTVPHPARIAIETAGDNVTQCMRDRDGNQLQIGTPAYFTKINRDLRSFFSLASKSGARTTFIEAPPMLDSTWNAAIDEIDASASELAAKYVGVSITAAPRNRVSKNGAYVAYMKCSAVEAATDGDGCVNGKIPVRTVVGGQTGTHLCPTGIQTPPDPPCAEYSSGERRYGSAETTATLRAPKPAVRDVDG